MLQVVNLTTKVIELTNIVKLTTNVINLTTNVINLITSYCQKTIEEKVTARYILSCLIFRQIFVQGLNHGLSM